MINARDVSQSYDVGPAVIRALSSLTHKHASQIAQALEGQRAGVGGVVPPMVV
jgi:hypothetical protein